MALITVATHTVRLDLFQRYEELVGEVANAAVHKREKWNWTAHQVAFGETGTDPLRNAGSGLRRDPAAGPGR